MRCCHFTYQEDSSTQPNGKHRGNVFGYIIETGNGIYVSSNLGHRWTPVEQVNEMDIIQMMRHAEPPPIPMYGDICRASDLLKETWLLGGLSLGKLCVLLESINLTDPLYGDILNRRVTPKIAHHLLRLHRTTTWPSNVQSWLYDRAVEETNK